MARFGMRNPPRGGFGNRVLNYLNLRQLAADVGQSYFSNNPVDKQRIAGIHRPPIIPVSLRKTTTFSRDDVHGPDFLPRARAELAKGRTVILKAQLLAHTYSRIAVTNPREFTQSLMTQCRVHRNLESQGKRVGVHLRGSDFVDWNPDAILGAEYYLDAIDWLEGSQPGDYRYRVCTEDAHHPALERVTQHLRARGSLVEAESCESPLECDFASMAESEVLISSPSTFAIVAGLLGSPRVIHSRSWVDSRTVHDEGFWQGVDANSIVGYSVLQLI